MNEIRPLYRYNPLTKQQEMVYPKTHINAVVTEDGKSITELINELNAATVEQITQIIQNAPQEYDTLLEIATALNANRDSIATILQAIENKQDKLNYTAENVANKGVPNGYAGLDASGKVPNSQLPEAAAQVTYSLATELQDGLISKDDFKKQANFGGVATFTGDLNTLYKAGFYAVSSVTNRPSAGGVKGAVLVLKADTTITETQTDTVQIYVDGTDKIFVRNSIDKTGTWTAWVNLSTLTLGITSTTAYRGDLGDTAYQHAITPSTNPHGTTKDDVGLGNVQNIEFSQAEKDKLGSIPADNVVRCISLTQAAYDALSTVEKNRVDTFYFIQKV